jgi:hypothetical protein
LQKGVTLPQSVLPWALLLLPFQGVHRAAVDGGERNKVGLL